MSGHTAGSTLVYSLWRSESGEPPVRLASKAVNPHMLTDSAFPVWPFLLRSLLENVPERLRSSGCWELSEEELGYHEFRAWLGLP